MQYRLCWHRDKIAIEYDDAEGKRRRRSTGATDEIAAHNFARDFFRTLAREQRAESPTIGQIVEEYLNTTEAIGAKVMKIHWEAAKPTFGDLLPAALSEEHCRDYARTRKAKPGTIIKEMSIMRSALNRAARQKWIPAAPYVWLPPAPPPRDRRLTKAEAKALLAGCSFPHLKLFVTIALHTCARSGAILDLTWDRVDLKRRRIDFAGGGRQKRRAVVPINKTLLRALKAAHEDKLTQWVIEWGGDRVRSVKKGFRNACAQMMLKGVSPHVLRHTAASWMAEKRVPMAEIAAMLGHSDSRITERVYAKFSPDYLAGAAAALE